MIYDSVTVEHSTLQSTTITVPGYKHALVSIFTASICIPQTPICLENVPNIEDTKILTEIITALGGYVKKNGTTLELATENITGWNVPEKLSEKIHGAIYLMPVLLGRFGKVEIGNCGGCHIGAQKEDGKRPIKHMISVLEKFGATFSNSKSKLIGSANKFHATTIDVMDYSERPDILTGPLVSGATKTAILAALSVENGVTRILNPYTKPDVTELVKFLKIVGYQINYSEECIEISKVNINANPSFYLMSDISQIMTYMAMAVFHKIELKLEDITVPDVKAGLKTEFQLLNAMGIKPVFDNSSIYIPVIDKVDTIDIEVTSLGIYSDHQPFFALLLLSSSKSSIIREQVWKDRFSYAVELKKLGFVMEIEENKLLIKPSFPSISGQKLHAKDLRAAAVLLLAALKTQGQTYISGLAHLNRGYDNFIPNLIKAGAKISALEP